MHTAAAAHSPSAAANDSQTPVIPISEAIKNAAGTAFSQAAKNIASVIFIPANSVPVK